MSDPASQSESESAAGESGKEDREFSSQTIGVRAQKKLASKLASQKAVKIFVDATSARVFDKIYKIVKEYTRSRSQAQKLMKRIIKLNMKIGVLYLNDILDDEEKARADEFRDKFNDLANDLVRMHSRKAARDLPLLVTQFRECEQLVLRMVRRHLSDKSVDSVRQCGEFFTDPAFMSALFSPTSCLAAHMNSVCCDIQNLLDRGII